MTTANTTTKTIAINIAITITITVTYGCAPLIGPGGSGTEGRCGREPCKAAFAGVGVPGRGWGV
eukprot:11216879-Lingulodinium_polyedra.AAC.1